MNDNSLNDALRHFEATEANLVKLEKLWGEIGAAISNTSESVGVNPIYEDNCRSFQAILAVLPSIDGWKPEIKLMDLIDIFQGRLEAREIGEPETIISIERSIYEPESLLREYRFRFNQKRRELIRDSLTQRIDAIDSNLSDLSKELKKEAELDEIVSNQVFDELIDNVDQINTLLGSSVPRPKRWSDLRRHLNFRMLGDLRDIIKLDWPNVKAALRNSLYGEKEPVPVAVEDLGAVVSKKPRGPVATKLHWGRLTEEEFERLIFTLLSSEPGYENPEWLMKTNAPDRGRDLSVYRVLNDTLGGTIRHRVIIQCKHWLNESVSPSDVAKLREQMKLWEPPRVDVHIIATSGRFTSDAVALIEKQNQSENALRIEMWPESHLERLLASRPAIIAEFSLR
ncbi:MAG: restriction endonuclease [Nitrososphaera sp.]|nr:restriction endonuclease [Nitrososphaera sp.]